ncbi:MAG: T9SS type A sorting domain-containing protein [Sphingobacteriales bacterium]|nr:T9SS type A sorting domain-containing protein [Sphingobacteriales bacterium]
MKHLLLLLVNLLIVTGIINAQLCPGGGSTFASAVKFSQSWIAGCSTGTSCTGGTTLDNRTACEPTTALDACAPAPSCTSNTNGSDIWFSFYVTGTTASISVIQSVSFIAVVQAYSGGPTCGTLTQIGCAVAGGPSSGVTLNLTGLSVSQKYYFRVFGSSNSAAQRTGTYCFCGSTGLVSAPLPVVLTGFTAELTPNRTVAVKWSTSAEINHDYYILEHSTDGTPFYPVQQIRAKGGNNINASYTYTDLNAAAGKNYYRLKIVALNGEFEYSDIVSINLKKPLRFAVYPNPVKNKLYISGNAAVSATIVNSSGIKIKTIRINKGANEFSTDGFASGLYFVRTNDNGETVSFTVIK